MDPSPLSMVINLRRQAEASSATESLFHKRVGGWIEWDDVHKARRTAMERLRAHAGDYAGKRALLRDAAAISLLSLIPPDRVGLIRKLRLGHTLKRAARGGWRLDLTKQKDGHKTSRFYGPFAAQLPRQLDSVLDAYAAALSVDSPDAEEAYLFHPASGDLTRPLDSSAWTAFVRRLFGRLHGSEVAPKTLRSSFITWLRATTDAPEVRRRPPAARARRPCPPPPPPLPRPSDGARRPHDKTPRASAPPPPAHTHAHTPCPQVLKSAAHAMKHNEATQASGTYDANADTKLVKAAYDFNLAHALTFGGVTLDGSAGGGGGSGGGGGGGGGGGCGSSDAHGALATTPPPAPEPAPPPQALAVPCCNFAACELDPTACLRPCRNETCQRLHHHVCSIAAGCEDLSSLCAVCLGAPVRGAVAPPPASSPPTQSPPPPAQSLTQSPTTQSPSQPSPTPTPTPSRRASPAPTEHAEEEDDGAAAGGDDKGEGGASGALGSDPPRDDVRHSKRLRLSLPPDAATAVAADERQARTPAGEEELDVGGVSVGDSVLALGLAPSGQREWFRATVKRLRARAPPISVRYVATESGETGSLLLPQPPTGFVYKAHTKPLS